MTRRVPLIQRTEEGSLRRIIRGGGHEAAFVFVYGLRSQEKKATKHEKFLAEDVSHRAVHDARSG